MSQTFTTVRTAPLVFATVLVATMALAAVSCSKPPTGPSPASRTQAVTPAIDAAPSPVVSVSADRFGSRTPGVVYVTSQGLYYDTFVVRDPLPRKGRFQLLVNGQTEFGPGDPGYLGGRWWEDLNNDGIQDPDDHYFLCPLLPPGRPTP
jgi:hypothetical protein